MNKQDILRIEYISLGQMVLWENNVKLHDIGTIQESFYIHGFKDPPKFEPKLNDGKGGIVEGNGRSIALKLLKDDGREPPRGVIIDVDNDDWLIPVIFGVDADSELAAEAYGVDHNSTTLSGGNFDLADHMRLYDDGIVNMLGKLAEGSERTAAYSDEMVDLLVRERRREKKKKEKEFVQFEAALESDYHCPKCGYEWSGNPK